MKLFALLFLVGTALLGKAWGYGVPGISVGEDSELLTDTPIPIPHLTATPTITATPFASLSPLGDGNHNEPLAQPNLVAQTDSSAESVQYNHGPQQVASASGHAQQAPTLTFTPQPTLSSTPIYTLVPTVTSSSVGRRPFKLIPPPIDYPSARGVNSFREQGFFEAGFGLDPPVQGSTVPGTAAGVEAAVGLLFKDGFAVQLDFETFSQSNSNAAGTLSENEVLVLPSLRRYLTAGSVRPYLSIGNGLAITTTTLGFTSLSVDSFDLALGGGVEFLLDNYFSTYVEGKYNFVFMSGAPNQDIPVAIGARLGF